MTLNKKTPQKPQKRVRGDGIQRFAKACKRVLRNDAEQLAASLFRHAARGNASSARLLLRVLQEHPEPRCHKKRNMTVKQALAHALRDVPWHPSQSV